LKAAGRDPKEGSSYLAGDLEFIPFRHLDGPARGPAGFMSRVEELSSQFETYNVRAERLEQAGEPVSRRSSARGRDHPGAGGHRRPLRAGLHAPCREIVGVESFSTFDEAVESRRPAGIGHVVGEPGDFWRAMEDYSRGDLDAAVLVTYAATIRSVATLAV